MSSTNLLLRSFRNGDVGDSSVNLDSHELCPVLNNLVGQVQCGGLGQGILSKAACCKRGFQAVDYSFQRRWGTAMLGKKQICYVMRAILAFHLYTKKTVEVQVMHDPFFEKSISTSNVNSQEIRPAFSRKRIVIVLLHLLRDVQTEVV